MRSSAADGEHGGPVWAVRWQQSAAAAGPRSLVFVSISSDGRLVEWAVGKAKLAHEVRRCRGCRGTTGWLRPLLWHYNSCGLVLQTMACRKRVSARFALS